MDFSLIFVKGRAITLCSNIKINPFGMTINSYSQYFLALVKPFVRLPIYEGGA